MTEQEEQIQSLALEIRILEGYQAEISDRQIMASRSILESRVALEAIKTLPPAGGYDILVPLGGGVFANGKSEPIDRLIVSVGANFAVEKRKDAAMNFLDERIKEVSGAVTELEKKKTEIASRMNQVKSALNEILAKQRAKQ